jgi:predicted lactoylglutathione lyase
MEQFFNSIKEEANKEVYTSLFEQLKAVEETVRETMKKIRFYRDIGAKTNDEEKRKEMSDMIKKIDQKENMRENMEEMEQIRKEIFAVVEKEEEKLIACYFSVEDAIEEKVEKAKVFMESSNYREQAILTKVMVEIFKKLSDEEAWTISKSIVGNERFEAVNELLLADSNQILADRFEKIMESKAS